MNTTARTIQSMVIATQTPKTPICTPLCQQRADTALTITESAMPMLTVRSYSTIRGRIRTRSRLRVNTP